jgi:hypothetical protein
MKTWLLVALASATVAAGVPADEPAPADKPAVCPMLNQRILGPRSDERPLPLLAGSAARGFRPACSVLWGTLSPNNQPLKIVDCFRGSLLQVANDAACGPDTGPLWVSARWVITTADKQQPASRTATCQQLETSALAATRELALDCVPKKRPPAEAATPATPAAAAPHP